MGRQTSASGITHSIMIAGNPLTMEISEADEVVWQYSGEGAGTGESEAWLRGHPGA